ncbi:hypothetical protein HPB51_029357 [Rhipicephalus microplus]|uniref:Uncharacterized protein n=1 Tax=Rhipicephalus microplus TaxID=6941 RepID=A0A9J6CUT8_RHIMP|nr:hypothetical protein HPB51_029357 [Rhipicephalus microplus]
MDMWLENVLPDFARVGGHTATYDYRGVKSLCPRCHQEDHFKAQFDTPHCARCGVFRHNTDTCTAPCRRCGGAHASVDCTARKLYSMAAAMDSDEFPILGTEPATGQTQRRMTTLCPAKRLKLSDAEERSHPSVIPEKINAGAGSYGTVGAASRQPSRRTDAKNTVAAESGTEGVSVHEKDEQPAARRGSQAEQKRILKGKSAPETSTAMRRTWWDKKGDDGLHSCGVLQTAYDKLLSSSAMQEKSVKAPGDAPKHSEPLTSSRQQSLPEPAQQHGGAS